jgi:hypothetical protein
MLPFEEKLVKRLLAVPAITGLVETKIHWNAAPDTITPPHLNLEVAGDARNYNHDAPDNLQEVRVRFNSRATNYLDAKKIIRAVLTELETAKTVDSVIFEEGRKVSGSDAPTETWAGGTKVFRVIMDVIIQYREGA